jgi:hypothetical protein
MIVMVLAHQTARSECRRIGEDGESPPPLVRMEPMTRIAQHGATPDDLVDGAVAIATQLWHSPPQSIDRANRVIVGPEWTAVTLYECSDGGRLYKGFEFRRYATRSIITTDTVTVLLDCRVSFGLHGYPEGEWQKCPSTAGVTKKDAQLQAWVAEGAALWAENKALERKKAEIESQPKRPANRRRK